MEYQKKIEPSGIEKIYGIKHLGDDQGHGMGGEFRESTYTNGRYSITVNILKTDGKITPESTVNISDNVFYAKLNYDFPANILDKYQFIVYGFDMIGVPAGTTVKTLLDDFKSWENFTGWEIKGIQVKKDGFDIKDGIIEPDMTIVIEYDSTEILHYSPLTFNVIAYID